MLSFHISYKMWHPYRFLHETILFDSYWHCSLKTTYYSLGSHSLRSKTESLSVPVKVLETLYHVASFLCHIAPVSCLVPEIQQHGFLQVPPMCPHPQPLFSRTAPSAWCAAQLTWYRFSFTWLTHSLFLQTSHLCRSLADILPLRGPCALCTIDLATVWMYIFVDCLIVWLPKGSLATWELGFTILFVWAHY